MRTPPHHWINADGFCHAGDMFEAGTPAMGVYTAEQVVALCAEAWDEGRSAGWSACDEIVLNPYE